MPALVLTALVLVALTSFLAAPRTLATAVPFAATEKRQHLGVRPAEGALGRPAFVIERVATDVEGLVAYVTEKNHPALSMPSLL